VDLLSHPLKMDRFDREMHSNSRSELRTRIVPMGLAAGSSLELRAYIGRDPVTRNDPTELENVPSAHWLLMVHSVTLRTGGEGPPSSGHEPLGADYFGASGVT